MAKKNAPKSAAPKKPGPAVGPEGRATVVAVSLPETLVAALERWREARGVSKSQAVAEAVRRLVSG